MSEIIVMFPPRAGVGAERLLELQREFESVRGTLTLLSQQLGVRMDTDSPALRVCARDGFCGQLMELAAALGLYHALRAQGVRPRAMAVHCLGVYTALGAAECATVAGVLELLRAHMECVMSRAGELTTVKGVSVADVELFCMEQGDVEVSTHNGPSLCTVSGPPPALLRVERWAQERNGKFRRLSGFGAWHFSKNEGLREELTALAERYITRDANVPIWFPLRVPRRVFRREEVVATVVDQVVATVCWHPFLRDCMREQRLRCVEVGPARPLAQFGEPAAGARARMHGFQTQAELSRVVHALSLSAPRAERASE